MDRHVGPTSASARSGRVSVTVHGSVSPDFQEWCEYLEWVRRWDVPLARTRTLVYSMGGGPDFTQRKLLTDLTAAAPIQPKAVVLTRSKLVRGMGVALSWFNSNVRTMAPEALVAALRYLELEDHESRWARDELATLRQRVDAMAAMAHDAA